MSDDAKSTPQIRKRSVRFAEKTLSLFPMNFPAMNNTPFETLSRERLIELLHLYARNLLALDGLWFQSVEAAEGMDAAMEHDRNVWRRFPEIEARRIREFLQLPERPGLEGLARALEFRFTSLANRKVETGRDGDTLTFRVVDCRVQSARTRKGMPLHPCKSVGLNEYSSFARAIDERIECRALSCYPEVTDPACACSWQFRLRPETDGKETQENRT